VVVTRGSGGRGSSRRARRGSITPCGLAASWQRNPLRGLRPCDTSRFPLQHSAPVAPAPIAQLDRASDYEADSGRAPGVTACHGVHWDHCSLRELRRIRGPCVHGRQPALTAGRCTVAAQRRSWSGGLPGTVRSSARCTTAARPFRPVCGVQRARPPRGFARAAHPRRGRRRSASTPRVVGRSSP
jgi:hypothetical protein